MEELVFGSYAPPVNDENQFSVIKDKKTSS